MSNLRQLIDNWTTLNTSGLGSPRIQQNNKKRLPVSSSFIHYIIV